MNILRRYENYEDYVNFQKNKTLDPVRREKWLNEEWEIKLVGFEEEFNKIINIQPSILSKGDDCLCLGARTGQEVQALKNLGMKATGIDLVPCEPLVTAGDIHDLKYENNTFDFVFTNIIDHTIYPQKMISEVERVLKPGGHFFLQMQVNIKQDEYTEYVPNSAEEIINFFSASECMHSNYIFEDITTMNAHGMNFEMIFRKNN